MEEQPNTNWDNELKPLEPVGFIQMLRDEILKSIPTAPDWAEAIAISLEASALEKMRIVNVMNPLALNVWFLNIGASGLAHKSLPLRSFVYGIVDKFEELTGKKMRIPSRYTVEGLIEYLCKKIEVGENSGQPEHNTGLLIRDEFTSLLKEYESKSYLSDQMEFLSELFDGVVQSRMTRKTGLEEGGEVYINFLGTTTPYLYSIMDKSFFIQGTGNRLVYIIHDVQTVKRYQASEYFVPESEWIAVFERAERYGAWLRQMYDSPVRFVQPASPIVGQMWTEFKYEIESKALDEYHRNPLGIEYVYNQRLPVLALKLAGLSAVSRRYDVIGVTNLNRIFIEKGDMLWAIFKTRKYQEYFRLLLENWAVVPTSRPVETDERSIQYMRAVIKRCGLISQSRLLQETGMVTNKNYYDVIKTLVDLNEIEVLEEEEVRNLPKAVYDGFGLSYPPRRVPVFYKYLKENSITF